jgi:hypothetical protein
VKFKIESIFSVRDISCVMVRQLEAGEFSVSSASRLSGVPLHSFIDQPRKLRPDGSPDLEVFVFSLVEPQDSTRLSEGQIVELLP